MMQSCFKRCGTCGSVWSSRESLVRDPSLELGGYQVSFARAEDGLFLFTHVTPRCRTTLAVRAGDFRDYYDGLVFSERRTGRADCPGLCLNPDELSPCPAACAMGWVRQVLQHLREHRIPPHIVEAVSAATL